MQSWIRSSANHLCLLLGLVSGIGASEAQPIDAVEDWVLTADRAAELANFAPGSDEHWYYRCLLAQQNGQLVEVDNMLKQWRRQHRYTDRFHRIQMRQTLLWVEKDPSVGKARLERDFSPDWDDPNPERHAHYPTVFPTPWSTWAGLEDEFKQQGIAVERETYMSGSVRWL